MTTLLKNVHIISPKNGLDQISDILIEDDTIIGIGKIDKADKVYDYSGKYAFPGLVDIHVHLRDPGQTYKEDIISGCNAAAAGGVTSLLCMPNTSPTIDNPETIEYVLDKAKNANAKVYVAAAITKGIAGTEATDLTKLKQAGAIGLSDDGRPVLSEDILRKAMINAPKIGMTVVAHCEDLLLAEGGKINQGVVSEKLGIKGIPNEAEDNGTKREIEIAKEENVPIHICHVSTRTSVEMIRKAKACGVKITAETAPHYLSMTQEELYKKDADFRMNPPLRTEEDKLAIIAGLKDGTLDCIATDHAPHSIEDKADFEKAPNGSIGMETSLAVTLTELYHKGQLSLADIVDKMSTAPAKIIGIDSGTIEVNKKADIAIVDINKQWVVDVDNLHGKSKNTPFKGKTLKGKVIATYLNGEQVYGVKP